MYEHELRITISQNSLTVIKRNEILLNISGKDIKWSDENIKEFEATLIDFIHQCHIRPQNKEED